MPGLVRKSLDSPEETRPFERGTGYVQLSAEGLGAGAGMWQMGPEQLARYRAAVASDDAGGELLRMSGVIKWLRRAPIIESREFEQILAARDTALVERDAALDSETPEVRTKGFPRAHGSGSESAKTRPSGLDGAARGSRMLRTS